MKKSMESPVIEGNWRRVEDTVMEDHDNIAEAALRMGSKVLMFSWPVLLFGGIGYFNGRVLFDFLIRMIL